MRSIDPHSASAVASRPVVAQRHEGTEPSMSSGAIEGALTAVTWPPCSAATSCSASWYRAIGRPAVDAPRCGVRCVGKPNSGVGVGSR